MLGKICRVLELGTVNYPEAVQLQERLVEERRLDRRDDTLVLLQHSPVITLGRRAESSNILVPSEHLLAQGITVHETNRGGNVTYHGPGQLVGYPILRLADHGDDIHRYLRMLEEAIILLLRDYGLEAEQQPGYTGVWIGRDKIAALGVAVRGGITMHGFALNIDPNLDHFRFINPCGYTDRGVTSIAREMVSSPEFAGVQLGVSRCFGHVFGMRMVGTAAP